jgi:hypothetical protein
MEKELSRIYDMDPALFKEGIKELRKNPKDWVEKFLKDDQIKRAITINELFYQRAYENALLTPLNLEEETHRQFHERLAEFIIAFCIYRSGFDAKYEFCTDEGKNKKDRVDFKVFGKEDTYLIEIRSTRESERSQEINKIYLQNICVDENPYKSNQRLQRQILEKCTKRDGKDGDVIPHKFPKKDETKAKHIIVCLPFSFDYMYFDGNDFKDVLYQDYSYAAADPQSNERGIFHKDRTDIASQILQERIDCVVFIKYNNGTFEAYLGYNPRCFGEEDSMKEFETMLAMFFDSDNVKRIHQDPIYGLIGAEVTGIKPTDQPFILQDWFLGSSNIMIDLEKKIAELRFQNASLPQHIAIPFSLDVFKNIDLEKKEDNSIKHHILGCLSLDKRVHQPLNTFINTIYKKPDNWLAMLDSYSSNVIFDKDKILMLISSADKLYRTIKIWNEHRVSFNIVGNPNNPCKIIIPY